MTTTTTGTQTDIPADIPADISATQLADQTPESLLAVTDKAMEKVLQIREGEEDGETLGLQVEITGTSGADFTYDLSFGSIADAPADASVYTVGELTIIIPANSIQNLTGASLDLPSNPMQGGLVIRNPNKPDLLEGHDLDLTGSLAQKLQQLLDRHINPSLAAHGGFAKLERVDGTVVYISMGGGCQGCAMSAATLKEGITAMIDQALPEVTQVLDVTDHDSGENPYYS